MSTTVTSALSKGSSHLSRAFVEPSGFIPIDGIGENLFKVATKHSKTTDNVHTLVPEKQFSWLPIATSGPLLACCPVCCIVAIIGVIRSTEMGGQLNQESNRSITRDFSPLSTLQANSLFPAQCSGSTVSLCNQN